MAFDKKNPPKKSAISFPARMVNSKASGFFRIAKDLFSDRFRWISASSIRVREKMVASLQERQKDVKRQRINKKR